MIFSLYRRFSRNEYIIIFLLFLALPSVYSQQQDSTKMFLIKGYELECWKTLAKIEGREQCKLKETPSDIKSCLTDAGCNDCDNYKEVNFFQHQGSVDGAPVSLIGLIDKMNDKKHHPEFHALKDRLNKDSLLKLKQTQNLAEYKKFDLSFYEEKRAENKYFDKAFNLLENNHGGENSESINETVPKAANSSKLHNDVEESENPTSGSDQIEPKNMFNDPLLIGFLIVVGIIISSIFWLLASRKKDPKSEQNEDLTLDTTKTENEHLKTENERLKTENERLKTENQRLEIQVYETLKKTDDIKLNSSTSQESTIKGEGENILDANYPVLYVDTADMLNGFSAKSIKTTSGYFKIIQSGEKQATIEVIDNTSLQLTAANNANLFLDTVCIYKNAPNQAKSGIVTTEKGILIKDGENWVIQKKPVIRFI